MVMKIFFYKVDTKNMTSLCRIYLTFASKFKQDSQFYGIARFEKYGHTGAP